MSGRRRPVPRPDRGSVAAQAPSEEAILEVATQIAGKVAGCVQETLEKAGPSQPGAGWHFSSHSARQIVR